MTDTPKITEAVERVEKWLTWLETANPFAAASIEAEDLRVLLDAVKAQTEPDAEVTVDDMAKMLCRIEGRRTGRSFDEAVAPGVELWVRHRYEAEKLLEELDDMGFTLSPKKGQDQ